MKFDSDVTGRMSTEIHHFDFNHDITSITHDESWMHFLFFFIIQNVRFLIFKRASSSQHSSLITRIEWCISLPSINFLHFSLSLLYYFSLFASRCCAMIPPAFFPLFNSCIAFLYYIYFYVVSDVHRVTSKIHTFYFGLKKNLKWKRE